MNTIKRMNSFLVTVALLMAVPFVAGAYEVSILDGQGAESKALNDGEYKIAIQRLEQRLQHGTRDRDIRLTNLCTAYVVAGELEKAKTTCDQAVEANGDYVGVAFNSRGVLNALKGDFVAALADFKEAGDQSNYPIPRRRFGDDMPSMRRFSTPQFEIDSSIQLATKNYADADRLWAASQAEKGEALAGSVK